MNTSEQLPTIEIKIEKERGQNEKKITSIEELHPGDHIVIVFNDIDYFHAILVSTENIDFAYILELIFYSNNTSISTSLQELIEDNLYQKSEQIKNFVQKTKLIYDNCKYEIYKVLYDDLITKTDVTLDKASNLIGESKYNAFENNDEHFAIFCKTGKAGKLFLIDTEIELFGSTIYDKIKNTLRRTGTNIILFNVAQRIASRFPRSILASSLPTLLKN
jgi:hypothetical protein